MKSPSVVVLILVINVEEYYSFVNVGECSISKGKVKNEKVSRAEHSTCTIKIYMRGNISLRFYMYN